ncbi:MAG: type II CAAX prenyl endopeptidase Rce1 family protein [Rhodomicrobium sp.]
MMLDRVSISSIPLFSHLSPSHLDQVERLVRLAAYQAGETVFQEGTASSYLLYIIIEGEAVLSKRARCAVTGEALNYELEVRRRNQIFGWISVLDGKPLPMTVMARTPLTLAILDLNDGSMGSPARHIRNVLITELRRYLACFVRSSLETRVTSLQHEAEYAHYRNAVGAVVITTLALLSFYTLTLSLLPRFESALEVNFVLSPIVILFFGAFFFPVIEKSGFPHAFFGLRLDNWRTALPFAARWSLAFLGIVVLLKWLFIATIPRLHGLDVISFADVRVDGQNGTNTPWYLVAAAVYLLLVPVQEFVARCGVQAPLYAFLQGSELKRGGLSILVSNLVFSAVHAHIGVGFALVSFIPGLFWGWIFLRTNSLLAASLSHLLIGGAGVFLLGIEELVRALG